MKVQSLRINHFGHFADFELSFQDASFVVLHGQNEAGKSTLLDFLRKVLFGFDERERYAFVDGDKIGGRLIFDLADRRRVELFRRKGRKNTVQVQIDGAEAALDEAGFARLIGDPDANLFKSIFAFGLDELRAAEQSLQHESLRSALYAGGLGSTLNPQQLLDDFESQSNALFKAGGSKPVINMLSRELSDLTKQVKQAVVKPDEYLDRERKWRDEQARADQLATNLKALREERLRIDVVLKALPLWIERHALTAEREQIVLPPQFPHDARQMFEATHKELRRLADECDELRSELDTTQLQQSKLKVDATALAAEGEIAHCAELAMGYRAARNELPELMRKYELGTVEVQSELHELRPGWSLDNLQAFSLSAATRHALTKLAQRHDELRTNETRLKAEQALTQRELQRATEEVEGLGGEQDVSQLARLVDESHEYVTEMKSLAKERETREKLRLNWDTQRLKLSPPLLPSISTPERLAIPPKELVLKCERDQRDAQTRLAALQTDRSTKEKSLRDLQDRLQRLDAQHVSVPKLEELTASRQQRDEQWSALRTQFIEGEATVPPVSPMAFEASIIKADQLADAIYENADSVSQRERLKHDIVTAQHELEAAQSECEQQQDVVDQLLVQWCGYWSPLGIEPLPPEAMTRWLDEHAKLVEITHALAAKDIEINTLTQRAAAFEELLRTAFSEDVQNSENAMFDIANALAHAKKLVKAAESAAETRKKADRDLKKQRKNFQALKEQWEAHSLSEQTWQREWQELLTELELPSDWSIELAESVIQRLSFTQTKLKQLTEHQARIDLLRQRVAEFEPLITSLAERLQELPDHERLDLTARRLQERATQAAQDDHQRQQLSKNEQQQLSKLKAKTAEQARRVAERADLLRRADLLPTKPTDEAVASSNANDQSLNSEFLRLAALAERAAQLNEQRIQLSRQLALLRGGHESETDFEARLHDADEVALRQRLDDIERQLHESERDEQAARESAGSLRRDFETLDGTSQAATIQELVAQKQSQLVGEIHRYVPLVFARRLFSEAIQRFERENQPALIGEISRLFASLTRGEYVEIERPTSDRDALSVRRHDGAERTPDQLSTGTREQLYLAIRLGYIRHYCRHAEPLPIVMDDVLVNFDIDRARATLETLREFSSEVQVLFFTCHRYFVDVIRDVIPEMAEINLPRR